MEHLQLDSASGSEIQFLGAVTASVSNIVNGATWLNSATDDSFTASGTVTIGGPVVYAGVAMTFKSFQ